MRNQSYRYLLAFSLLLTAALTAAAQNYRPFGPGRTYHYREAAAVAGGADSLYTFRVDSIGVAAGGSDSLLLFNRTQAVSPSGSFGGLLERVNLYGGRFHWNAATGVARFQTADRPAVVELRTRAAVGQSWLFTTGVQATLTGRAVAVVLTQPDTVATIALSDGQTLRLSRRFGLISGPDFTNYLGRTYRYSANTIQHQLQLVGLPEVGLPGLNMTGAGIYDLAPGDSLFYASRDQAGDIGVCFPPASCSNYDYRSAWGVVVRSRQLSPNGDTVLLGLSSVTTAGAGPIYPVRQPLPPALLTGGEVVLAPIGRRMVVASITQHPDSLAGIPRVFVGGNFPDGSDEQYLAPSLGVIRQRSGSTYCCYDLHDERLVGFYKSQTRTRWGNTQLPRPTGLSADQTALAATLAPNPAAATATTLRLTLPRATALHLTLLDPLGRAVWQQTSPQPAGDVAVAVPTAGLPAGLYHLRVAGASGRPVVLPLMRAAE